MLSAIYRADLSYRAGCKYTSRQPTFLCFGLRNGLREDRCREFLQLAGGEPMHILDTDKDVVEYTHRDLRHTSDDKTMENSKEREV